MPTWSWGLILCSSLSRILQTSPAFNILRSGVKATDYQRILWYHREWKILSFARRLQAMVMLERLLHPFNHFVDKDSTCNSCLLWFWCSEEVNPIFRFVGVLAKSREHVVKSNDGRSGISYMRESRERRKCYKHGWIIYSNFLGKYNLCKNSPESSVMVWDRWYFCDFLFDLRGKVIALDGKIAGDRLRRRCQASCAYQGEYNMVLALVCSRALC